MRRIVCSKRAGFVLGRALGVLALTVFLGLSWVSLARAADCVPEFPPDDAYRIYFHNPGICASCDGASGDCVQDLDMDFPEYLAFMSNYQAYLGSGGTSVIGDSFVQCTNQDEVPHGSVVRDYYEYAAGDNNIDNVESSSYGSWEAMVQDIASTYGEGTVVNLSNGSRYWGQAKTQAVLAAYNAEVLLVGAVPTFASAPFSLGDKVLQSRPMDARGQYVSGTEPPGVNVAQVCVPTSWYSGGKYLVAKPASYNPVCGAAWDEHGSFTCPLLAGTVKRIADIVMARDAQQDYTIAQVLDYVISSCDRNVQPESYSHRLNEILPSFGPWSSTWGYGVYSPWKAMLYAYGFGKLEAVDASLDPVDNPPTVFSDHFELRGDLFVPAGQTFRVTSLASINVVTATPEGPTNLGVYPDLQEVRVDGDMDVECSLQDGVNCTVVIEGGGVCTVKHGGVITIDAGQKLDLRTGGELVVEDGGLVIVNGEFLHSGTLTLADGGVMVLGLDASASLDADLDIPLGATFAAGQGVSFSVGTTDAAGAGNDPDRVEINCAGALYLVGAAGHPVTLAASGSAGDWVGISVASTGSVGSVFNTVNLADASVGLALGGTAPVTTSDIDVTSCGTGVQVSGRSNVTLSGGAAASCTTGVDLSLAGAEIDGMVFHDDNVGIKCSSLSSPRIRNCSLYSNVNGVLTLDSGSIPDLGTVSDPGNNAFPKPWNSAHISAYDPESDIDAQENWWGTTKGSQISSRIFVIDAPPSGAGSVIYLPILTGPPSGPSGIAGDFEAVPGAGEAARFGFVVRSAGALPGAADLDFRLTEAAPVSLSLYDVRGRRVRVLVNEELAPGEYSMTWDGRDDNRRRVSRGVYFAQLVSGNRAVSKKVILAR